VRSTWVALTNDARIGASGVGSRGTVITAGMS
jgi:hypothetical protein